MRLPAPLRPPPSLRDVEQALLAEVGRYCHGPRPVPNAWGVELSPRDNRKHAHALLEWSALLAERVVHEHQRLGLPASGLVTVSFAGARDVAAGLFRVVGRVVPGAPAVVPRPGLLPGRPRLVLAAGGTAPIGSPQAAGIDREVMLPPGAFVIGRDKHVDLHLHDHAVSPRHAVLEVTADRVRLRDLGSLNGTTVDGKPCMAAELVDCDRIELGGTTLVFHRDAD